MTSGNSNNSQPFYAKWANIPFSPAKMPVFYGWVIVAVSTLSIICSVPGQTAAIGAFTDSLIDALKISRQQLSLAYMIGTIISGLILPHAGKMLDKVGVRVMSVFSCLGLAASLMVFANAGEINDYLHGYFSSVYVTIGVAAFSFLLVRFFGQGNMTMVGRVAMGKWFNHWRGIATAIAGVPIAFAFNAAPWLMNKLIELFGWQGTCILLAIAIGGGMTVIGALLFRDNPEECGLTMDGIGETESIEKDSKQIHTVYRQFTRSEAIRTTAFWAFVFGLSVYSLVITAVSFNITSIGQEMGKTKEEALKMFFYSSFISIPSRFFISFLVDKTRLKLKFILAALGLTLFCYIFGLAWFDTGWGHLTAIIGLGLASGTWGVLNNVTFPRYFGRKNLGAISGVNMSAMVIASAIGPALYSYCKQWLGSYRNVSIGVLILPMIIIVISFVADNPQHKIKDAL